MKRILFNTIFILSLSANIAVVSILGWNYYQRTRLQDKDSLITWQKRPLDRVLKDEMGLKKEEIVRLRKNIRNQNEDVIDQRGRIHRIRHELRVILSDPKPDRGALEKKLEELNLEQGRMNAILINRLLEIKDTLPDNAQGRWRRFLKRGLPLEKGPGGQIRNNRRGSGRRRGRKARP